jgi:hypothetical protein
MHDARDVAKQRQQYVEPEVTADSDLQENSKRRQYDGDQDAKNIQVRLQRNY